MPPQGGRTHAEVSSGDQRPGESMGNPLQTGEADGPDLDPAAPQDLAKESEDLAKECDLCSIQGLANTWQLAPLFLFARQT